MIKREVDCRAGGRGRNEKKNFVVTMVGD